MTEALPKDLEEIREFRTQLLSDLTKYISSGTIAAAARRLKLWQQGRVCLDEDDSTAGLTFLQYCILDFTRNGTTALDRYLAQNPPQDGSPQARFLDALSESAFTIHKVVTAISPDAIELEDVSSGEKHVVLENGFWTKAKPGMLIATRLVKLSDLVMTSGVFFGLASADADDPSPPRIPAVSTRAQALERTEALLQSLLQPSTPSTGTRPNPPPQDMA